MPPSVVEMIESDAKLMVWGAAPKLISNERGSSKRSRPYIAGDAKYKSVKLGGAGLMCWSDHCNAYYAHWIVRLLHPRRAQYKKIIYHWLNLSDNTDLDARGNRYWHAQNLGANGTSHPQPHTYVAALTNLKG